MLVTKNLYQHIKVPGFGCTYPNDFVGEGGRCRFELRRLVRDEVLERISELPTIALPIEAGQGAIRISQGSKHPIDYEHLVVIPKNTSWLIESKTPILKVLFVEASSTMVAASIKEFNLDAKLADAVFTEFRKVTRTTWVNEIFHRYAFERSIAKNPYSAAAQFLEAEIVKEIYYASSRKAQADHNIPFFVDLPEPLRRALTLIEQRLHESLTADEMAASAMVSKPTLVRLFRNHLDTSPVKYLWSRRLEEADRLLLTGRYSVSEVAGLLGFSDSSSFSKSFNDRFGIRPSSRL